MYWKRDHARRQKTGIKAQILFNTDANPKILEQRNSYKGCDARYMPIDIQTPAMIFCYKDTTCITIQHPVIITIEIVNQQIADSFKAYFDAFWKESKKF